MYTVCRKDPHYSRLHRDYYGRHTELFDQAHICPTMQTLHIIRDVRCRVFSGATIARRGAWARSRPAVPWHFVPVTGFSLVLSDSRPESGRPRTSGRGAAPADLGQPEGGNRSGTIRCRRTRTAAPANACGDSGRSGCSPAPSPSPSSPPRPARPESASSPCPG